MREQINERNTGGTARTRDGLDEQPRWEMGLVKFLKNTRNSLARHGHANEHLNNQGKRGRGVCVCEIARQKGVQPPAFYRDNRLPRVCTHAKVSSRLSVELLSKGLLSLESVRFLPSLCRPSRRAAGEESAKERENAKERSRMVNAPNAIKDIIFSAVEKEGKRGGGRRRREENRRL